MVEIGRGEGNGKTAHDPRDSGRENELITGGRISIDIDNRTDEVRRKVYRVMLNEGQQEPSTGLCDRVVVRKWVQHKSHHHVQETRTFSKRSTW